MSLIIDEHRQYLSDPARLDAFDRAICSVVRKTDVVIDLGCGTGILGLMACRAGARRVYAIDDGGMIDIAREAARANGYADRIVHIQGASTRVTLPERADLVVSDQIGRLGFEAGVIQFYADAHRRLLKPEARVVPEAVATWVAPVEQRGFFEQVEFWRDPRAGFTFAGVRDAAVNTGYPSEFQPGELLAPGAPVVRYALTDAASASQPAASGRAVFTVARAGVLHGLAGWFVADLAPGVTLTNAPGAPDRVRRRQSFLPIDRAVPVREGDRIEVLLLVRPADTVLVWRVRVEREGRELAAFDQTTLRGMLLTGADLTRTHPDARPQLDAWARARGTVIALADGSRTLHDIAQLTWEQHRDLLPGLADAATFVSTVVSRPDAGAPTDSL